jgi:hypothetical protein
MRLACLVVAPVLAFFALAGGARSEDNFQPRSYTNGQQLFQFCADDRNACYTYIYGVLDMLMLGDDISKKCTFDPVGASGDKVVNAVMSYLKEHQDRWDWSGAALIQNTVRSKFPCKKKKP